MPAILETSSAIANAEAQLSNIEALWEAHDFLDNPRSDADDFQALTPEAREHLASIVSVRCFDDIGRDDAEALADAARDSVLSACVRSFWAPIGEALHPAEFELLLSTGGPACRIVGDLDDHGTPGRAELQWQDWGTPWTALAGQRCDALNWFAGLFYFGG